MAEGMVDFFAEEECVEDSLFGICDDPDESAKTPAYVNRDIKQQEQWGARVINKSDSSVAFNAIDNKIEITRDDGNTENRCDAMLHNDKCLVFVELKSQMRNWIKYAVEIQLATTIRIFKENHDITKFHKPVAYVCNTQHPCFSVSHKEYMDNFRKEHGVRLVICRDIVLK